jgi:hypothetical protein
VDVASGAAGPWTALGTVRPDFTFGGSLSAASGWYMLEVRVRRAETTVSATVERGGVGEVFVVVGHSVAHGGSINLPGAEDDRVNTIAFPSGDLESRRRYDRTGDAQFLPDPVGRHFDAEVRPAPAGNGTYFWAAFAEHVARAQNVPVLVLNAAFGGTSLEHWAKSSRGEPFEHGFVNASLRMPYVKLQHTLQKYGSVLGLRAILADQGQNDGGEKNEEVIFANYQAWMDQARRDCGFPALALVVNRQSPPEGGGQVRRIQERMIRQYANCFPGPDYDGLAPEDTTDKIHLSESGARKAARLWATALDDAFFKTAVPWVPRLENARGRPSGRPPQ